MLFCVSIYKEGIVLHISVVLNVLGCLHNNNNNNNFAENTNQ